MRDGDDEDRSPSVGPVGGGATEVAKAMVEILEGRDGRAAAVATVIGRSGSAPQVVGAKSMLLDDGTLIGTVGGGAIEAQVLDACRACLRDGQTRRIQAHLVRDLGMCCGGAMEVFIEYVQPEARLVLVGAGHVAQAVAPMAASSGFRVVVVDDRESLFEHPAFSRAICLAYDVDELGEALPDLTASDYVIIVTRDHARDETALTHLVGRPHRYLGMIGSRRKVHSILARVRRRAQGLERAEPDLSRLRAPVGLALGGRTPGEIAVSILAEVVAERHGGQGRPMSIVDHATATDSDEPRPPTRAKP